MYECKILADSIGPNGVRLTTILGTFPRFILAEVNTHRVFSRNSASSRAIPITSRIARMEDGYFYVPEAFGKNQKGMSSAVSLDVSDNEEAQRLWEEHRKYSMETARQLAELGAHKQWAARPLELHSWHTAIITSTEWDNYVNLRVDKNAQPEFQVFGRLTQELLQNNTPRELRPGEWHLPFMDITYPDNQYNCMVSAGRCAAVSYDNLGAGKNNDKDLARAESLMSNGHMSPFEHQARCMEPKWEFAPLEWDNGTIEMQAVLTTREAVGHIPTSSCWWGNLRGWGQFRKSIPNEAVWTPRSEQ